MLKTDGKLGEGAIVETNEEVGLLSPDLHHFLSSDSLSGDTLAIIFFKGRTLKEYIVAKVCTDEKVGQGP